MNEVQFARQVRSARAILDWTLRDLAERAQVAPDTITRIESGDHVVKLPYSGAVQNVLENAGIEFQENGSVLFFPHMAADKAGLTQMIGGIEVDESLPLGNRRKFYGQHVCVSLWYTTTDKSIFFKPAAV